VITMAHERGRAEGGRRGPSVQIVVKCALSVAAEQCCQLDFITKEFVWLVAGIFNPVLGSGI
jgi:hypothetical protein